MTDTSFTQRVIDLVRQIPEGKVMTYGDIAHALGSSAYRAVGQVMKNNEHGFWEEDNPKRIPCHRVVASGGKIGGYSRGLEMKKKLLESEGINIVGELVAEFPEVRVGLDEIQFLDRKQSLE